MRDGVGRSRARDGVGVSRARDGVGVSRARDELGSQASARGIDEVGGSRARDELGSQASARGRDELGISRVSAWRASTLNSLLEGGDSWSNIAAFNCNKYKDGGMGAVVLKCPELLRADYCTFLVKHHYDIPITTEKRNTTQSLWGEIYSGDVPYSRDERYIENHTFSLMSLSNGVMADASLSQRTGA